MKVFISYAREDIETARKLYHDLKQAGISPWMDKEDILIGENWKIAIRQAMKECSYFLALLSSDSLSKQGYVQKELKMALDILAEMPPSGIFLLPVRLDDCNPLDERLQDINWGDLFPSYEEGFQRILKVLSRDRQNVEIPQDKKENTADIPMKKEDEPKEVRENQPLKTEEKISEQGSNNRTVGITGDAEKSVLVSGNGNVINIHTHEPVNEEKKSENTTPFIQPKRNSRIGKIPTWLTAIVLSAIIIAGIIRFYPSESPKNPEPSIKPTAKSDPPVVVTPPPPPGDKTFTNSLGMKFVKIPAGTFTMGSPKDEPGRDSDETQHEVTISKPFFMQTTEVTQGQWKAVMGDNPSYFKNCGDDCPVEQVSWDDVQGFIKKLNRKGEGTYRLPTEAEWEYAARAGTTTPFAFGNCLSTDQANYDGNYPPEGCPKGQYREKTVPVGSLAPNAWGLYDMHGNVWEWCADWKGDYPSGAVSDPTGPSSGSGRVLRGGGWNYFASYCRTAYRYSSSPGIRSNNYGFRLVRP